MRNEFLTSAEEMEREREQEILAIAGPGKMELERRYGFLTTAEELEWDRGDGLLASRVKTKAESDGVNAFMTSIDRGRRFLVSTGKMRETVNGFLTLEDEMERNRGHFMASTGEMSVNGFLTNEEEMERQIGVGFLTTTQEMERQSGVGFLTIKEEMERERGVGVLIAMELGDGTSERNRILCSPLKGEQSAYLDSGRLD